MKATAEQFEFLCNLKLPISQTPRLCFTDAMAFVAASKVSEDGSVDIPKFILRDLHKMTHYSDGFVKVLGDEFNYGDSEPPISVCL